MLTILAEARRLRGQSQPQLHHKTLYKKKNSNEKRRGGEGGKENKYVTKEKLVHLEMEP